MKLQYEVGLGDENSEKSIYDDLPTVEDGLMDIILVDVNLVFSTVDVEDSKLDEAVETEYVDVDSEVETTVTVVDVNLIDVSSVEVEDLRLNEAVDTVDVDVDSKVETTVTVVDVNLIVVDEEVDTEYLDEASKVETTVIENSETSIYDDLPTVEDGLMDIILVDVNLVFSSVEVEDSRLDEAVDTEDVEVGETKDENVDSEVETTVIEVGLGNENSKTSIYDDLPTVEDGLMDIILVDINLVFSTVEVEDSRLDEADETEDVYVESEIETTVIVVDVN